MVRCFRAEGGGPGLSLHRPHSSETPGAPPRLQSGPQVSLMGGNQLQVEEDEAVS